MKMQVVFPMAGSGQRFIDAGYRMPKPLIPISGKPMIAHLLERFPRHWRFVFLCNEEHLRSSPLRDVLLQAAPRAVVLGIAPHKRGPVHTLCRELDSIDDTLPTLVNYCDFDFAWDPSQFAAFVEETGCAGAIVCYRGYHPHHQGDALYAYCRTTGDRVLEVREKRSFSTNRQDEYASSGTYYFKTGSLAKRYLPIAESRLPAVEGEHYVSEAYNLLIADGLDVRAYEIPCFLQWGTPEDLEDYLYWENTFSLYAKQRPDPPGGHPTEDTRGRPRVLMPMAGMGTRFACCGDTPKPLVRVLNRPMFRAALDHLPCRRDGTVLVVRESFAETVRRQATAETLVSLPGPTAGQAATCLHAKAQFDPEEPVLVSACDHGLLWDERRWRTLVQECPDAIVFGQRHYPGARRSPTSYSYIETDGGTDRVRRVSVKGPLSHDPRQDLLLVGTFYFRRTGVLFEMIERTLRADLRTHGEIYLDSTVNICLESGLDVRCFETDAYLCWGSPESLREFDYWHRFFIGGPRSHGVVR